MSSDVTSEGESNTILTLFDSTTTNLINADNLAEASYISSTSTSPNSNGDTSVESSSNQDEFQKLSIDNSLSSDFSDWDFSWAEDDYASKIFPRVYLGAQSAATSKTWLENHDITHILTVSDDIKPAYPESYTYKVISIRDCSTQNLMVHFDITYEFIQSALQQENGNILVHCYAGISRSPSVVIAYIMKARKMSFNNALEFVRSGRPIACPNPGFREQLKVYESSLSFEV